MALDGHHIELLENEIKATLSNFEESIRKIDECDISIQKELNSIQTVQGEINSKLLEINQNSTSDYKQNMLQSNQKELNEISKTLEESKKQLDNIIIQ